MRKINKKSAIKWGLIALIIVALAASGYAIFKPEEEKPSYLTATAEIGDIENNAMVLEEGQSVEYRRCRCTGFW